MPTPVPHPDSFFVRLKKTVGLGAVDNTGVRGESQAGEFLRRERGFIMVTRNWRNPHDRREEIDLVARDGDVLVFIEVKTRAAHALVSGYHAVNSAKKTIMRRAIKAYLARLTTKPRTFRFDIVEVTLPAAGANLSTSGDVKEDAACTVRHFENVALFPKFFHV